MKIYVDIEVFVNICIVQYSFLNCPYRWMIKLEPPVSIQTTYSIRVKIETVQVIGHSVKSIVATCYTIRVDDWYHFENEVLPQYSSLLIIRTKSILL